jgi:hypothetical protein
MLSPSVLDRRPPPTEGRHIMNEELRIEETEVYETPVLAEAGDYTEMTQGTIGVFWEGWTGLRV